ncbi:MAG TPA: histidinol-phosphatase [Pirellulales bacterium]|jgi:histidinol phosphatase-like enzyme (inositol monophosphatase family)|nr:histidinol-phosphatase [Pirellulales bacterium]
MQLPSAPSPPNVACAPEELTARLELALAAAHEAGRLTLDYFARADLAVELKADDSPVTIADRQAEELLRARVSAKFPDDAILGEEFPERPGTSGFRWILDPIDGTKSFIHGVPLYGTLVAVEFQRRGVVGVIAIPALDEWVYAAVGQGAWHVRGGRPPVRAAVSQTPRLADSLFCTSDDTHWGGCGRQTVLERLQAAARLSRTWGDCYGYLLVATGRAELMVDPAMSVWDAAALQPVLEEAGGTFTNWRGEPTIHSGEGIATNGKILSEVLSLVGG